jgi:hypothetical protein
MLRDVYRTPFQVDHIIARQHGGSSTLDNLALACFHCNTHKGPNIAGVDSSTGKLSRLFHPRKDRWAEHFAWNGPRVEGLTALGRATVQTLALNDAALIGVRESLLEEGLDFGVD